MLRSVGGGGGALCAAGVSFHLVGRSGVVPFFGGFGGCSGRFAPSGAARSRAPRPRPPLRWSGWCGGVCCFLFGCLWWRVVGSWSFYWHASSPQWAWSWSPWALRWSGHSVGRHRASGSARLWPIFDGARRWKKIGIGVVPYKLPTNSLLTRH